MPEAPVVLQKECADCCVAITKAIFKAYKSDKAYAHFGEVLGTNGYNGSDPRTLESFLWKSGFKCQSGSMSIADLKSHSSQGRLIACVVTLHGSGHYVLVDQVRFGKVRFLDPNVGIVRLGQKKFAEIWVDFDRFGLSYLSFGIATWKE